MSANCISQYIAMKGWEGVMWGQAVGSTQIRKSNTVRVSSSEIKTPDDLFHKSQTGKR